MIDHDLLLVILNPKAPRLAPSRPEPRRADRDAISSRLMRYRDQNGQDWADIIDFLTIYPELREVVRVLAELRLSVDEGPIGSALSCDHRSTGLRSCQVKREVQRGGGV